MYEGIIQKAGYKLTKPRLLVLKVLEKDHKPLSAKSIHTKLQKKVDLASIYRIICLFQKLEILFEERINAKRYYYLAKKQHHHIICRICGYAECIPCHHLFSRITNFSDILHKLSLSGICTKCSKSST
jgi:Fe2+ or Zn2+ uptake regulation protein